MDEKPDEVIPHSCPTISEIDSNAVQAQLLTGNIAKGNKVTEFENAFSHYTGFPYAKFTDSGSKAIKLALQVLGLETDDEVILPTYVCHSVIDAVKSVGAIPVLCDVSDAWNVSVEDVAEVISPASKAIILVHTMGIALNSSQFKIFGLPIIEDCCQSLGSIHYSSGLMAGANADFAIYSFHAIKCMSTGEGGMLCYREEGYRELIDHFVKYKADNGVVTDLQAALGISQLAQYPTFLKQRIQIAEAYFKGIENPELYAEFKKYYLDSNCYRFLLTSEACFLGAKFFFEKKGIAIRKGVDALLHHSYPYKRKSDFSNSENIFSRTISIPLYPSLSEENIDDIINAINSYEHFR